jgi:hypothetical protein
MQNGSVVMDQMTCSTSKYCFITRLCFFFDELLNNDILLVIIPVIA